jgi:hypothetical protein
MCHAAGDLKANDTAKDKLQLAHAPHFKQRSHDRKLIVMRSLFFGKT